MTSVEQVMLKLGVDNSAVASGLRSFKSKITSALSGVASQLIGAFAMTRVISGLNSVIQKFGALKEQAQNLGVSTDFMQGLGMVADVTNSSLANVEKGINKLAQSIGKAQDGEKTYVDSFTRLGISMDDLKDKSVEEIFYAVADGMKATDNQASRVNTAMELLGRSGSELVTLLSKGSDEVKGLINNAEKLTEAEINSIAQLKDALTSVSNKIQIIVGRDIGTFARMSKAVKEFGWASILHGGGGLNMGEHQTLQAKTRRLIEEQTARRGQKVAQKAIEDAKELEKEKEKGLKQEIVRTKTLAMLAKEKTAEAERLVKWQEAGNRLAQKMVDRDRSLSDRSKFTLQEMADRGAWVAQDVMELESSAKDARWVGNFGAAQAMTDRALEMRKGMSDFLIDSEASPFRSMDESLKAQRESLEKLGEAVEGSALRVIPVNGE